MKKELIIIAAILMLTFAGFQFLPKAFNTLSEEYSNKFYISKNNCAFTDGTHGDCQLIRVDKNGEEEIVVGNVKRDIVLISNFLSKGSPVGNEEFSQILIKGSYGRNIYLWVNFTEGEGETLFLKYDTESNIAEEIKPPFDIRNTWERGPELIDEPANCKILGVHNNIPIIGVIKNDEVWTYNIEKKELNKYKLNDASNCSYYNGLDINWDDKDLAISINGEKIILK